MEKDSSLIGNSPITKKNWHNGPQLTILAQDPIQGGAMPQYREGTGTFKGSPHKVTNNTGPGAIYGVGTPSFNAWMS